MRNYEGTANVRGDTVTGVDRRRWRQTGDTIWTRSPPLQVPPYASRLFIGYSFRWR